MIELVTLGIVAGYAFIGGITAAIAKRSTHDNATAGTAGAIWPVSLPWLIGWHLAGKRIEQPRLPVATAMEERYHG